MPRRNGWTHQSFFSLLLYACVISFSAVLPFSVQCFVLRSQCAHLPRRHPLGTWMDVPVCDCSLTVSRLPVVIHPQAECPDAVAHAVAWLLNELFPPDAMLGMQTCMRWRSSPEAKSLCCVYCSKECIDKKKAKTLLRRVRTGETCLEHHTAENNSDFYKTITVNIATLSERLR